MKLSWKQVEIWDRQLTEFARMCQNIMNFYVFGFTNRPECDIIYCAGYTPDFGAEDVIADERVMRIHGALAWRGKNVMKNVKSANSCV